MDAIWGSFVALLTSLLVTLYGMMGSFGIAIIAFTIIVRLVFLPLSIKSSTSMRDMQSNQAKLKPHLDALKKKYGSDRQKLMEEQNKLYKEFGISPMAGLGGCLPMLIQMPIWIGLYSALFGLAATPEFAAPFLWVPNLATAETFPYILTAFTGISQYAIAKMTAQPAADDQAKTMNKMMQLMMPAMMVWFATQVPAGLVLYWAANNIFQFFQQLFTTGWGDLWPSRRKIPAGASAIPALPVVESKASKRAEAEERSREGKSGRESVRNGRNGDARVTMGQLPEATATERNGLRIYTLDPEDDGGADMVAEGSSLTTEEAIERARSQGQRAKRKKRKL